MQKMSLMTIALVMASLSGSALAVDPGMIAKGKTLSYDSSKGNCLACHMMPTQPDATDGGNSGPPLIAMQARFPEKSILRTKIWDASATNPSTFMPVFGKHKALTESEIDAIVEFVYGL